mmetsp:Transcript_60304/g.168458  ORF Transcript_60304/g.168458 Transcript_60304/m.168458 type:complete len:206 (+) Transcript_60304:39-656(+)
MPHRGVPRTRARVKWPRRHSRRLYMRSRGRLQGSSVGLHQRTRRLLAAARLIFNYGLFVDRGHVAAHLDNVFQGLQGRVVRGYALVRLHADVHVRLGRVRHSVSRKLDIGVLHQHVSHGVAKCVVLAFELIRHVAIWTASGTLLCGARGTAFCSHCHGHVHVFRPMALSHRLRRWPPKIQPAAGSRNPRLPTRMAAPATKGSPVT